MLSGNRNFEGRVSPDVQANYLASPPLVVAHAIAGTVDDRHRQTQPLGKGSRRRRTSTSRTSGPTAAEVNEFIEKYVTRKVFAERYADVFGGDAHWRDVNAPQGETYAVGHGLDLRAEPAVFRGHDDGARRRSTDIVDARILAMFGDKITTDHISPAGSIKQASPAGTYLSASTRSPVKDFNQYGTRRGNHEIMMRGTFANIRIKNFMLPGRRRQRCPRAATPSIGPMAAPRCRSTTPR